MGCIASALDWLHLAFTNLGQGSRLLPKWHFCPPLNNPTNSHWNTERTYSCAFGHTEFIRAQPLRFPVTSSCVWQNIHTLKYRALTRTKEEMGTYICTKEKHRGASPTGHPASRPHGGACTSPCSSCWFASALQVGLTMCWRWRSVVSSAHRARRRLCWICEGWRNRSSWDHRWRLVLLQMQGGCTRSVMHHMGSSVCPCCLPGGPNSREDWWACLMVRYCYRHICY